MKPVNLAGFLYVLLAAGLTLAGIYLSLLDLVWFWLPGQFILSIAFLQWFILLHEAGHGVLFRTHSLNTMTGHIAGFMAGIPYVSWRLIHNQHHQWTGWQDLDPTTESLVTRELSTVERNAVNICWRLWIPVFNVIYRVNNFWNYPRIKKYVESGRDRKRIALNIAWLVVVYGIILAVVGAKSILSITWLAILLSLVIQENVLLSQHTHIPSNLAEDRKCSPFPGSAQSTYTRSIRFPIWAARFFLINFDRHELHHMYVRVPGYLLHRISLKTENDVDWLKWLVGARKMEGQVFLFQDRTNTGFML